MANTFGLPHLIIILVIILLLFGAPKLPGLAKSIGQSMKIFRTEIKNDNKSAEDAKSDTTSSADKTSTNQSAQSDQSGTSSNQSKTER
jgi:sec-independent protein translocase protein TatA